MKVKVGDKVFDSNDAPLMVVLSPQDKDNIANMHPACTKYATFPDGWGSKEEMLAWMNKDDDAGREIDAGGPGYRLINPVGDRPQEGDEVWSPADLKWLPIGAASLLSFDPERFYRRKETKDETH